MNINRRFRLLTKLLLSYSAGLNLGQLENLVSHARQLAVPMNVSRADPMRTYSAKKPVQP
jgi:hypothetical protein